MFASILGGLVGLGSSIFGGIKANEQAKKAEAEMAEQRRRNDNWYRRRYNEDPTQTAEAQMMIRRAREEAQRQLSQARGIKTVMGGTDESVAEAQEAGNRLISDTLGAVASNASARKDAIDSQYRATDNSLSQQYVNLYNQRAANATAAANAGMQAGMGLLSADLNSALQVGRGLFGEKYGKTKKV